MQFKIFFLIVSIAIMPTFLVASEKMQPTEETLYGLKITDDDLIITVISNGCTKKDHFDININKGVTGLLPFFLTILRTETDACKKVPKPIDISFSKEDLKLEGIFELIVKNKFGNTSSGKQNSSDFSIESKFEFTDVDNKIFVIKLNNADNIKHAHDILSGKEKLKTHVQGTIIKSKVDYNHNWSYHLDPNSIEFFSVAIEVCDSSMQWVEDNLDIIGEDTLPNNHWCPWSSSLVREIK